jgi:hypothetical protein
MEQKDCWGYSGVIIREGGKAIGRATPFEWAVITRKWGFLELAWPQLKAVPCCADLRKTYQMRISFGGVESC